MFFWFWGGGFFVWLGFFKFSVTQETYPVLSGSAHIQEIMLFHCLPLLRGRKLPCLLKDSLLIIPAHWHRITTFWEPERQPQPHGQGDVLPALQLCCSHYGFTTLGTCLTCSVIQIPGILRDLESPALPQKPDNSTISPSNKFTLLKFLFLAIMLACNSLSCILLGCLCASNFPP